MNQAKETVTRNMHESFGLNLKKYNRRRHHGIERPQLKLLHKPNPISKMPIEQNISYTPDEIVCLGVNVYISVYKADNVVSNSSEVK